MGSGSAEQRKKRCTASGTRDPSNRCPAKSGTSETLLLEFVVNLPEAQGALGGFLGQLAVIPPGDLEGQLVDFRLGRPVLQNRFDRRPAPSRRFAGNQDEVGSRSLQQPR